MRNHAKICLIPLLFAGCMDSEIEDAADLDPERALHRPATADDVNFESQAQAIALVLGDCPGATRLIGVLDPGQDDCTLDGAVPTQWIASPLFEAGSPGVEALLMAPPAELGRYCAYDYVGPEGQVSLYYGALTATVDTSPTMDLTSLSSDCRGEFEQGSLYDANVGAELRAAFLTNIGWDMGAQIDGDYGNRETIAVAVVDTVSQAVADDPNLEPANAHGLQMAALIRAIDCPYERSACLDGVHHVLAMPRDDWKSEPDWIGGGHNGSQGDLAMGIYQAVEAWREDRSNDPTNTPPRLVINLSVGWAQLSDEPLVSDRGPQASVLAAMQYASCHGALMIAAAGNTQDTRCPDDSVGALAPATFETLPAPSASECAALGYVNPWTGSYPIHAEPGEYAPLVHAAGGVDPLDEPLINAREQGSPRLVALGANGLVDAQAEALSGTSVSAAVTSGTAALLWSYRPELRPDQVMQIIYDAGWDTGRIADFALTPTAPAVHRLSVCAALDAACTGQSGDCPTPACVATAPAADGNLSGFAAAVTAVLDDPQTTVETFTDATVAQAPECLGEPGESTDLTSPQPEVPMCSRCNLAKKKKTGNALSNDDELSLAIVPAFAGMIVSASLVTEDAFGVRTIHPLDGLVVASLNAQPFPIDVTRILLEAPDAVSASMEFILIDGSLQTDQIPVIEIPAAASPSP